MIKKYNNFLLEYRNDILSNPKFVKWFGNSKGVDENGKPKVYYHATKGDFDEFKRGEFGIHFGTIKQVHDIHPDHTKQASILPVYLKFENPIILQDQGEWYPDDIIENISNDYNIILHLDNDWRHCDLPYIWNDIIDQLKELGYDSVIYENTNEGRDEDSIIVFDSNQIKSAIGNTKFNPNSNNINENNI